MAVCIQGRKPVLARFVHKNAVGLVPEFVQQRVAEQAFLAPAGQDGHLRAVGPPGASADAELEDLASGLRVVLDVSDLPPAEPGTYYQGWVRSEDGEGVTIGTFHMRGGDAKIELWAGVSSAEYPIITVTIQEEGAGAQSSGMVVLRGRLDG